VADPVHNARSLSVLVADFGRAREASRAPHPISREAYASPERKAFAAAGAAAAAPPPGAAGDVWSIGVVLYEIMAQDLAAEGDGVRVAIQEGLDGPADEGPLERLVGASRAALRQRGPRARELLRLLLQRDADERPSAEDALSHPWLTEADGGESDGDSS
jgi:serine/threonine protein kinase